MMELLDRLAQRAARSDEADSSVVNQAAPGVQLYTTVIRITENAPSGG